MTNGSAADPIKHVLVLALENRSFDHMLGACQAAKPTIEVIPAGAAPRTNAYGGKDYPQAPGAARIIVEDPRHETPNVLVQLKPDAAGDPSGFVEDYATAYPMLTEEGRGEIMKYHALDALPALHALAQNFMVCDRWFSSVPGPTWTNRLFLMSGTALGCVDMPGGLMDLNLHWYDQTTIFDRLNERGKSWAVYHGDTPLSLLLTHQWEPANGARYKPIRHFFVAVDIAILDDHASHDVLAGDALIAGVYNALRANEELWRASLLVVVFDEHGGFYDHVQPPAAQPPDHHQEEYRFDRRGVGVPAILVSPYAANAVFKEELDHTSLLKYLIDKWHLGPLGERAAQANTFAQALGGTSRTDTPPMISAVLAGLSPVPAPPHRPLNDHQSALIGLSHALESMAKEDPAVIAARRKQIITGRQSQIDTAVDRVEAFLDHAAGLAAKAV